MAMFPIVKHLNPRATDGSSLFARGQEMVAQGFLKDGYQLINEALQLFTSVYGNIHTDVINAYRYSKYRKKWNQVALDYRSKFDHENSRLLAKIDYIQGSHTEAIEKQHKV